MTWRRVACSESGVSCCVCLCLFVFMSGLLWTREGGEGRGGGGGCLPRCAVAGCFWWRWRGPRGVHTTVVSETMRLPTAAFRVSNPHPSRHSRYHPFFSFFVLFCFVYVLSPPSRPQYCTTQKYFIKLSVWRVFSRRCSGRCTLEVLQLSVQQEGEADMDVELLRKGLLAVKLKGEEEGRDRNRLEKGGEGVDGGASDLMPGTRCDGGGVG